MITIHWFVLFALAVSALSCALLAWHHDRRARRAYTHGYRQGATDQAQISNRRLEAELALAKEQSYASGWNACATAHAGAFRPNGTVPMA